LARADQLGAEFQVNTYTTGPEVHPSVASDSSGRFVVVWERRFQDMVSSHPLGIYGQRFDSSGSPLGGEFRVNSYTTFPPTGSSRTEVKVGSDAAGNFVVVWTGEYQDTGSTEGISARRFDSNGAPLGNEFRVNSYTTNSQSFAEVKLNPVNGDFIVVWRSFTQDGDAGGVYAQRYASSGSPQGSNFRVNTYTTHGQKLPSVAYDGTGRFVIVWGSDYNGTGNYLIFGQRYASNGSPLGGEFLASSLLPTINPFPQVAANSAGDFVVAWIASDFALNATDPFKIYARRYASTGAALGSEFRVNTYTTYDQGYPAVAVSSGGNFIVTWSKNAFGVGPGIQAQRYASSGAPIGCEF